MSKFQNISKCRVCGGAELTTVFDLGHQFLTGVFPSSKEQPVTSGPVELVKCTEYNGCGLVQLLQSYDLSEMYGMNYGYRSGLNSSMVQHLHGKVNKLLDLEILNEGDLIIDIGSNDATTLKAYPEGKYELIGVDPTGIKFHDYYPPAITLVPDFFPSDALSDRLGEKKAKVITSFSMFYDLEDPVHFAQTVCDHLAPDGIWNFEQSYMPMMLATNSFDTICQEHLEFYSFKQIEWICDAVGMKVIDVEFNNINGGSFSIIAAKSSSSHVVNQQKLQEIRNSEETLKVNELDVFVEFRANVELEKKKLIDFLVEAQAEGLKVLGLGASTKGNVLLQYYNLSSQLLQAIGEVNPDKYGCYTPGTNIPLMAETEILAKDPDYLLVLPWHFKDFFLSLDKLKGRKLIFPLPQFEVLEVC